MTTPKITADWNKLREDASTEVRHFHSVAEGYAASNPELLQTYILAQTISTLGPCMKLAGQDVAESLDDLSSSVRTMMDPVALALDNVAEALNAIAEALTKAPD